MAKKEYNILIENVGIALKNSRQNIANTINTEIVLTYWQIGKYIIDYEQKGNEKAEYGSNMLNKLSSDLTQKYGKGFSRSNVFYIRKFYMEYPKGAVLEVIKTSAKGSLFLINFEVILYFVFFRHS